MQNSSRLKYEPKKNIEVQQRHAGLREFSQVDLKTGLQSLNLTGNFLSDFVGFNQKYVGGLQILILDKNPILSFKGFPEDCPELEWLSMIDCPISQLQNFRALAVAVVGPKLKVLNGVAVSANDKAAALTYGQRKDVFPLLQKGWIPCKPVNFSNKALFDRLTSEVNDQEKDPLVLRAVRLLKTCGWSFQEMRAFIKKYYEGDLIDSKPKGPSKDDDSLEAQVEKQQELISVLAAQLQALKSGNHLFTRYMNMVKAVAADLIANDTYLEAVNNGGANEDEKAESENGEHYEELRAAVIEFLRADRYESDDSLIAKLNELMGEEEDRAEQPHESSDSGSKSSKSSSKSASVKESSEKKSKSEHESDTKEGSSEKKSKSEHESDTKEESSEKKSEHGSDSDHEEHSEKDAKPGEEDDSDAKSETDENPPSSNEQSDKDSD